MKIILVDIHQSIVDAANAIGWLVEKRSYTDIRDIEIASGMAFISPANSLGFMDGGIDYYLSRIMFPNIEEKVKHSFKQLGFTTLLGRFYCPIGMATCVETETNGVYLIAAPTMWLPQDVHDTRNAYHSMYAILREADKNKIETLVIPGLCTGCGSMTKHNAISQMKSAHDDFIAGKPPKWSSEEIESEQPFVYMNTEFKHISIESMRHVTCDMRHETLDIRHIDAPL